MEISMELNGAGVDVRVGVERLLVEFLREDRGLTGTKVGCDTGQCGSCVVQVGGRSVKSCLMLAVQADGQVVTTIEGVGAPGELTALQESLRLEHGTQCGFCTPGMVMALSELLERCPQPQEGEVRSWLTGNLCRCTGYQSVVRAVQRVGAGGVVPGGPGTGAAADLVPVGGVSDPAAPAADGSDAPDPVAPSADGTDGAAVPAGAPAAAAPVADGVVGIGLDVAVAVPAAAAPAPAPAPAVGGAGVVCAGCAAVSVAV
ncbi:carbon-monoxide dehydrogenase small subunit [Streptacidiphilus sp. MAP12-16]|uniref:(2Fe-2S)-binding protein n=1 Tax=Streptacidiphilus sp. MAP12-16 TaxID=3156300 RepID=UPI003514D500